jgi:hypothetical protein
MLAFRFLVESNLINQLILVIYDELSSLFFSLKFLLLQRDSRLHKQMNLKERKIREEEEEKQIAHIIS